ncbi:MAG: K+/H+ antiporter subunit F [Thiohalocapsa sp.]|jgi:multicomponent K+:H+ antiporter subunit F|uniref:K+/H+ antiporter subunit F n=1 Tax=Thiohalocapsa sp. TaxID=2497641 RepID=UPI0025D2548B|nr:K+/H+ antiporter subunit F [Thiohalocapsa sp.]MCG6943407.1 K+/H+ antiporter subunit F [Thiohalocapsa sp.]
MILDLSLFLATAALSVSLLLCLWRLLRGPSLPDRVLALDTLYVNAIALLVLLGMGAGGRDYVESALLLALFGFATTTAYALLLLRGRVLERD